MLPINEYITGDCLEIMREWPDGCVDLIVTDPPYGVDYEGGHFHSGDVNIKRKRDSLENDANADIYSKIFPEFFRILKRGGVAYVFYAAGKSDKVFPHMGKFDYQMLIWNKTNAKFASVMARYHHVFEPFLYLTKSGATTWNGGTKKRSLWNVPRDPQNDYHPTQKPIPLYLEMIRNSSNEGDIVVDPFAGSGVAAVACTELNRRWICIDIEPKYRDIAMKRLQGATIGLGI